MLEFLRVGACGLRRCWSCHAPLGRGCAAACNAARRSRATSERHASARSSRNATDSIARSAAGCARSSASMRSARASARRCAPPTRRSASARMSLAGARRPARRRRSCAAGCDRSSCIAPRASICQCASPGSARDLLAQPRQPEPRRRARSRCPRPAPTGRLRGVRRPRRCRASRSSVSNVTTRAASRLRHARRRRTPATAPSTRARSPASSSCGRSRRPALRRRGLKCAIVAAMSSASRRERRNHVVPRSSWRARVDQHRATAPRRRTLLSSASIACHSGTRPKISRVSR